MANRQRSSNRRFRRVNYDRDGDAEREPLLSVSEHLDRVIVSDEKDVDEAAPQQEAESLDRAPDDVFSYQRAED